MNSAKQKLLLEYLISSPDTFGICNAIVEPDYFDPEFRQSTTFVKNYYETYSTTPSPEQVEAECGLVLSKHTILPDQIEYTSRQVERFCRRRAVEKAVLVSASKIAELNQKEFDDWEDFSEVETIIRDAILISLNRNLGLRYFEGIEERLEKMSINSPLISTGMRDVDELLFGGYSRKELLLVAATSGGGKSITLSNFAFNAIAQAHNVLYLSLELSEEIVAQRFDTMFTGIGRKVWREHQSEISTQLRAINEQQNLGVLDIIQMQSGTRANDIRSFLKEYYLTHNFMPDVLVVDYLDKMRPNEKNIDLSDVWTKDKLCAEQLRDIGVENNLATLSASQLNREAHKATHIGHEHIAGGVSKINESDIYLTIRLSETDRAQGRCSFTLQKTRNSDGVGETVYLAWDGKYLRITDEDKGTGGFNIKKKEQNPQFTDPGKKGNSGLLDLMSSI